MSVFESHHFPNNGLEFAKGADAPADPLNSVPLIGLLIVDPKVLICGAEVTAVAPTDVCPNSEVDVPVRALVTGVENAERPVPAVEPKGASGLEKGEAVVEIVNGCCCPKEELPNGATLVVVLV